MRFLSLLTVAATLLGIASAASLPVTQEPKCSHEEVAYTTYIGQDKNVKLQVSHCDDEPILDSDGDYVPVGLLNRRQSSTDVCGAQCTSLSL